MNPALTKNLTGYQTPESSRTVYVSRKRRIYASVNRVSIGSDNGLSLIRHKAIIEANAGLFSLGPVGTNFSEIKLFIHENADEIIVCEMAAILSRRRWVNGYTHIICATWYDYCSILTADGLAYLRDWSPPTTPTHPHTHSRLQHIPRSYPSLKNTPFRWFLTKKCPLFNRNRWFWSPIKHPFQAKRDFFVI